MSGSTVPALLTIALIAIGLLLADRYYRIASLTEGFQSSGRGSRCGVDLPPCDFPLRCMNGICRDQALPHLPPVSSIPVLP